MRNPILRLAGVLFVAAMFSSCFIGNTLARYSTEVVMTDSVRVARWGVTVLSEGSHFSSSYATEDTAVTQIANSVSSKEGSPVVAPGVSMDDVFFSVTGSPEVAVKVEITLGGYGDNENMKDVYLKAGTYTDYTKVTDFDADGNPLYATFTLTEDYHPLRWSLKNGSIEIASGSLDNIRAYLETADGVNGLSGSYDPNTNLGHLGAEEGNGEYTLSWSWVFSNGFDAADTLLGKLAHDPTLVDGANYSLDVSYGLSISIVQID